MAKANASGKQLPAAHYADGGRWEFALARDPSQLDESSNVNVCRILPAAFCLSHCERFRK